MRNIEYPFESVKNIDFIIFSVPPFLFLGILSRLPSVFIMEFRFVYVENPTLEFEIFPKRQKFLRQQV